LVIIILFSIVLLLIVMSVDANKNKKINNSTTDSKTINSNIDVYNVKQNHIEDMKLYEERIVNIIRGNYEYCVMINEDVKNIFSKNNILIVLEVYAYLYCLTDFYLYINHVDEKIRNYMFQAYWDTMEFSKNWYLLNITKEEKNDFMDDRFANYSNILKKFGGINKDYFNMIIEYQTQLFSEIIKNDKLSYFNPLPINIAYSTPIHLDAFLTYQVKSLIQEFIINDVIPLTKIMNDNFVNDYFLKEDYKVIN